MCCGSIPRLCECGCSEYDHDEPAIEDKAFYAHFGGTPPSRGKCNGRRLTGRTLLSYPPQIEMVPCQCQKFKDAFEPDYTCRMP